MASHSGCVFCGIVAGTLTAHVLVEDADTLAFLDVNPASRGHTLVVPKRHAADLLHIDADQAAAVMVTVRTVARLLDDRLGCDGLTLVQTNRAAGWQDVPHLHAHVVPRWDGDGLRRPWTPRPAVTADLAALAAQLRPGP